MPHLTDADPRFAAAQAISRRIQDRRRHLRLTQQDLAERLGEPLGTVNRWDGGHNVISSLDLVAVARALGTSAGHLLGEVTEAEMADEVLLAQYRALPAPAQAAARAVLCALSEQAEAGRLG